MAYRNNRRFPAHRNSRGRLLGPNTINRLPKPIRDELRMCVALRGYSTIREGDGKTLIQQHTSMQQFFHGINGSSPSQVQMLAEGTSHYKDLYETGVVSIVTSKVASKKKNRPEQVSRRHLKIDLSRDENTLYYVGSEIRHEDLEKKNRVGRELLNGRQLTDMARRGLKSYRKALSFANDKWDIKKNEPKESGTTVEDVIEYVRCKMYLKDVIVLDDDEYLVNGKIESPNKKPKISNDDSGSNSDNGAIAVVCAKQTKSPHNTRSKSPKSKNGNEKKNDDEDCKDDSNKDDDDRTDIDSSDDDDGDLYKESNNEIKSESGSDDDDEQYDDRVPPNYIFPSFMAFILWGPFATKHKQLSLFLLGKYHLSYVC
jgi:hypothetical protein